MRKSMLKLGAEVTTRVGSHVDMPISYGHQARGVIVARRLVAGIKRYDILIPATNEMVAGARYAFPTAVWADGEYEAVEVVEERMA